MLVGMRLAEELYLVKEDPDDVTNLAADPKYLRAKRQLRERTEEIGGRGFADEGRFAVTRSRRGPGGVQDADVAERCSARSVHA